MLKLSDLIFKSRSFSSTNRDSNDEASNNSKRISLIFQSVNYVTCSVLLMGALSINSAFAEQPPTNTSPRVSQINNFITIPCEQIWFAEDDSQLDNQTYWLRTIDCAARLSASNARIIAKDFSQSNWSNSLKRVILIEAAGPSSTERKRSIELLNRYRAEFPTTLRPLLQILRRQQELELIVLDEAERYKRLEQFSNTEIAALKEERDRINLQFEETQQKLENIADIERQISARRQQQNQIEVDLSTIEEPQLSDEDSNSISMTDSDNGAKTENNEQTKTLAAANLETANQQMINLETRDTAEALIKGPVNGNFSYTTKITSFGKIGVTPSNALKNSLLAIQTDHANHSTIPLIFVNAINTNKQPVRLPFDNIYSAIDK